MAISWYRCAAGKYTTDISGPAAAASFFRVTSFCCVPTAVHIGRTPQMIDSWCAGLVEVGRLVGGTVAQLEV